LSAAAQLRLRENTDADLHRPTERILLIPAPFRFASGIFDLRGKDE